MSGSRMIRVRKRTGGDEPFDVAKLTRAIWRGVQHTGGRYCDALDLAEAIRIHLRRTDTRDISSEELFETVLQVLKRVRMTEAGKVLDRHRRRRATRREGLVVFHGPGRATLWDKAWLGEHVRRAWRLSPTTARIIAGVIEAEMLEAYETVVTRDQVLQRMNACVAAFGLADAVPVAPQPSDA